MGEYAWIWGLGAFLLAAIGFVAGWVGRIIKGEAAAENAKAATAKAEKVEADLAAFKTEVARDYASAKMVEQVEGRVVSAIDRLGDRLDNIVEIVLASSRATPRSAPRSRAAKS